MRSSLLVKSLILALSVSVAVTGCSKGKKTKNRVVAPAPQTASQPAEDTLPPIIEDEQQGPGTVVTIEGESDDSTATTDDTASNVGRRNTSGSTGLELADGSSYTTASNDELLKYLLDKEQNKTERQAKIEAAAINLVQDVKFELDSKANSVKIDVKLKDSKNREITVTTKGLFNSKNLAGQKLAHLSVPVGKKIVSGIVECLDVDGGCETMLATFKASRSGQEAEVKIVLRTTNASLSVELPQDPSVSSEYNQFETYILNSEKFNSANRIGSLRVDSFEVVKGKSGVLAQVIGLDKEFMSFGAHLLTSSNGIVDIKADRSLDVLKTNTSKRIANTLTDVRLVKNDGLGNVTFKASIVGAQGDGANTVYLTFNRKVKPVNHL